MPRINLLKKFCSCIKKTRKTVRVRKSLGGGTKESASAKSTSGYTKSLASKEAKLRESAAIGICVKSVLQTRGKTLRKFSCGAKAKAKAKKKFLQTKKLNISPR